MRFRIAAVLTLIGVVCACGWGQVRPRVGARTEAPFHRGVNLTGWFQAGSARQIQFTRFAEQDFLDIKSLGCDVIRLPINLHFMTDGAPDYTVDPLFFHFLDQVVDWCEELELHLILGNHTFDVRFIDTKTADPGDHPWRMTATIDQGLAPWDGQWHRVQMPLWAFVDRGSWDDGVWLNPRGQFDWSTVNRFEIVAEYHSFAGMQFWFDEIRVVKPPTAR
jgi:hypothetical protein